MSLDTLVDDAVATATVRLGSGLPGIRPGSSSAISPGGKLHSDRRMDAGRGNSPQSSDLMVTNEPTITAQAQTATGAQHFVQRIAIYPSPENGVARQSGANQQPMRNLTTPATPKAGETIAVLVIHTAAHPYIARIIPKPSAD